jgi:hypothetical protein
MSVPVERIIEFARPMYKALASHNREVPAAELMKEVRMGAAEIDGVSNDQEIDYWLTVALAHLHGSDHIEYDYSFRCRKNPKVREFDPERVRAYAEGSSPSPK